jgi:Flp pilus assembly protein TadG
MHLLRRLVRNRRGNFGMMTAILAIPVVGTAGMALDFGYAYDIRVALNDAADAAALGAISEKSAGVAEAVTMSSDGEVVIAKTDALKLFTAQGDASISQLPIDVVINVSKKGNNLTSTVNYTAKIPTAFLGIIGKKSISISGSATAVYQTESFIDFYMLLDNTPSMGVGATPDDVAKLVVATKSASNDKECAFACHIVSTDGVEDMNSRYHLARNIGATIRIDVVAKATASLMDEAIASQKHASQFRIAAYTFGETAVDVKLNEVASLTADLNSIKKSAGDIKLMSIPWQGYNNDQQTSFDDVLTKIGDKIDTPGDGTSTASREKIVFFVADGVGDSYKPKTCTKKLTGDRCQEPIDTAYCQALKDRGIKIAVLYTTYLPLPTNDWYNDWIAPFQTEIGDRMRECASDDLYFEVSPTEGIEAAMKALFIKAVKAPRLAS